MIYTCEFSQRQIYQEELNFYSKNTYILTCLLVSHLALAFELVNKWLIWGRMVKCTSEDGWVAQIPVWKGRSGILPCTAVLPLPQCQHFPSTNRDRSAGSAAGFCREQIDKASACHYLSCASVRKPCTTQTKCGNVKQEIQENRKQSFLDASSHW